MKKYPSSIVLIFAMLLCSPLSANPDLGCNKTKLQKADQIWAGHYYLSGVMEVGSEILLLPDGTFKWYMAYGAMDQYTEGNWWKNKNCIGLKKAKELIIFPSHFELKEKQLNVIWPDGTQRGSYIRAQP